MKYTHAAQISFIIGNLASLTKLLRMEGDETEAELGRQATIVLDGLQWMKVKNADVAALSQRQARSILAVDLRTLAEELQKP